MAKTTGTPAVSRRRKAPGVVPRAGDTIRPATPCSISDFSTSSWRTGFSAVLAMKGTMPADWKTRSMPTASSAKKGLVRSLMTMPMTLEWALRRLAAPRL